MSPIASIVLWISVSALGVDDSLVLHYTFDAVTGDTVKDKSQYGHDASIETAQYLNELDGRRGVMRFDGKTSILTCPLADALKIEGDMSFEMWVRENGVIAHTWGVFFGDTQDFDFYFAGYHSLVLWYTQRHPLHKHESMLLPVDRYILSDKWSHIAVVVEYPRCRFFHNGKMIRDAAAGSTPKSSNALFTLSAVNSLKTKAMSTVWPRTSIVRSLIGPVASDSTDSTTDWVNSELPVTSTGA